MTGRYKNVNYRDILVIIPARNEAQSLPRIFAGLLLRNLEVLLVDDASSDATSQIAKSFKVSLCRHVIGRGKGAALRTGFEWALRHSKANWIVFMDGDGQHLLEDLDKLIEATASADVGIILGERSLTYPMPALRRITNYVMTRIINLITGFRVSDSQCGLRILSRQFLEQFHFQSEGFEIESEMLLAAASLGISIETIPITTVYIAGRKSNIRPLLDTLKWITFMVVNYPRLFMSLRQVTPNLGKHKTFSR